jgi:hypothetical protein
VALATKKQASVDMLLTSGSVLIIRRTRASGSWRTSFVVSFSFLSADAVETSTVDVFDAGSAIVKEGMMQRPSQRTKKKEDASNFVLCFFSVWRPVGGVSQRFHTTS